MKPCEVCQRWVNSGRQMRRMTLLLDHMFDDAAFVTTTWLQCGNCSACGIELYEENEEQFCIIPTTPIKRARKRKQAA